MVKKHNINYKEVALNVYYCTRHDCKSLVSLTVKYFAVKNLVCYSRNNLLQTRTESEMLKQANQLEIF